MSETAIPSFNINDSAEENFNKYNIFMKKSSNFEDVKKCRWTFEGYLKSCSISEREFRRKLKEDQKTPIKFDIGGKV